MRPNPVLKWARAHFVERTLRGLPRTNEVLDLCCGYGFYLTMNPDAKGVDGDPVSVAQLKQQGYDVAQADVLKGLPYADGQFRHVIAHDVLEHFSMDELMVLMPEVHRVIAPGGQFWVFVPNLKGYNYGVQLDIGHKHYVTAPDIERLRVGLFELERNYAEPLPRKLGKRFTHNKEVFVLRKNP